MTLIELETFFDVRAEMRAQELDEWFSQNDLDEPGVMEVGAEIDGSISELDYLVKVFYLILGIVIFLTR